MRITIFAATGGVGVPLVQLEVLEPTTRRGRAIEDRHYRVGQGYEL